MATREDDAPSTSTGVGRTEWLFATPELPVADVRATQAYYRDVFGFRIAWVYEDRYGAVYNGRTEVYLRYEPGPIERACVFVRVENADRVLDAYRARGANVVEDIASRPWGMREFTVEELNGHRFRIGHSCGPVRASGATAGQG
jgi:catechol 2,3-dioxygenase-like lactoylglutathione lyase family enzyme